MKCLPICTILFIVQVAFGETADQIHRQLESTATATGSVYIADRDNLAKLGSNAVPQLAEISANTNELWQVRLMAGILVERIQRGAEIAALVHKNWRDDPGYKSDWDQSRAGPVRGLAPLVTKRCREMGLWWHYVELVWKETGEHSRTPSMHEMSWRGAALQACDGCPIYELLVRVLDDRIRSDMAFKNYENWGALNVLLNSKTNTPLPFLLEIIPHVPGNDSQHEDMMYKVAKNMAQPEDVPLIEKHFRDKGQDIPVMLREPLRKLKERQKPNAAAP